MSSPMSSPHPTSTCRPGSDVTAAAPDRQERFPHAIKALCKLMLALAVVAGFGAWCVGLPAQAASLASSAASSAVDSLSTSVGVFSNAVSGVSTSSSPGGGKVVQGDYRIERVRPWPGTPDHLALDLAPTGAAVVEQARAWQLRLPNEVAAAADLRVGQVLAVRERPYGFALGHVDAPLPFYLVVHDEWAQALGSRPVVGDASALSAPGPARLHSAQP